MRLLPAALMLLATMVQAGEVVSPPGTPPVVDDAGVVVINVREYRFDPAEITVKVGTTVRWVNAEKRQFHNIWFPDLDDEGREYFFPDEIRERTFDRPGTWRYICEPHDASHQMRGVVHVVE
jgi:plastocyanin